MKETVYPFDHLDELIEYTLNPLTGQQVTETNLQKFAEGLQSEIADVYSRLKKDVFKQLSVKKSALLISRYLRNIEYLGSAAQNHLAAQIDNPAVANLCRHIISALSDLARHIRERYPDLPQPTGNQPTLSENPSEHFKVLCNLSVDQIAILLKAADDVKMLSARSFSQVLKAITPHLSTPKMENFSWKSARTSTYKIENHDKQITLNILEAMIRKVKEYE